MLCFSSAVMYLYPGAIAGDSDKAYAAFPRFYALVDGHLIVVGDSHDGYVVSLQFCALGYLYFLFISHY